MMKRKKIALMAMFGVLGAVLVFHALIVTGVIPYSQVWAGRLKSHQEMIQFETVSIVMNLFMLFIFFRKYRLLRKGRTNKVIDAFIWIFLGLFVLNTAGNFFSQSIWELIFGSLMTAISAALCYLIVKK